MSEFELSVDYLKFRIRMAVNDLNKWDIDHYRSGPVCIDLNDHDDASYDVLEYISDSFPKALQVYLESLPKETYDELSNFADRRAAKKLRDRLQESLDLVEKYYDLD